MTRFGVEQSNWRRADSARQVRQARLEGDLPQVLIETERYAKGLATTAAKDLFAASVLAHDWLAEVGGVGPDEFTTVADKRAWASALSKLRAIEQRSRMDSAIAPMVDQYVRCRTMWNAHRVKFVDDPAQFLDRAREDLGRAVAQRDAASAKLRRYSIVTAIGGVLAIAIARAGSSAGLIFLLGGAFFAFLAYRARSDAENEVAHRQRGLETAEGKVTEYNAFFADPNGAPLLDRMAKEHPLLFEEPVPDPENVAADWANPAQPHVETKIVERQIVVTRCKYCDDMTPVDAKNCRHCGAPTFAT